MRKVGWQRKKAVMSVYVHIWLCPLKHWEPRRPSTWTRSLVREAMGEQGYRAAWDHCSLFCSVTFHIGMSCSSPPKHIQIQIIFPGLWHKVPGEVLDFDKLKSVFVYEWKGLEQATGRNGEQEIEMCFVGRIFISAGGYQALVGSLGVKWNASLHPLERHDSVGIMRL